MADVTLSSRAAYVKTVLESNADTLTMTQAERTKLASVATNATVNATNAELRDRSTHTGTQAQSTITNLTTDLAGKAATSHTHTTANITGLDATLSALAAKPESFVALSDTADTPIANNYLKWNSAGTAIEYVVGSGGGGTSGDEVSIADTAALLKVDKLSPTIYHPGPGAVTLAYFRLPVNCTINGVERVCGSGSGTFSVSVNGVTLSGLSGQTITTTKGTVTATGTGSDNLCDEGDEVRVWLNTAVSLADVRIYPLITRRYA